MMKLTLKRAGAALLALAAGAASAHDTWFQPLQTTPSGQVVFAIGTGNRFPLHEFPLAFEYLVGSGCLGEGMTPAPLAHVEDRPTVLVVRSAKRVGGSATCWAQLKPFEVEVPPDKIELYFREIQASPALRETWAAMKSRGLAWSERYTKYSRIELGGVGLRGALPLGMDVRLANLRQPIRVGDELTFQLLRDGAPLADFPVELISHLSPLGIWRRTDAEGRVRIAMPLAGRWLLRGTDLRVADGNADRWESRFVTLAFEVAAAAR